MAAVVAIDAAASCAQQHIQVLGGIGYTWEHEAHLYFRRALSLRALLGPRTSGPGTWPGGHVRHSRPVQVELPADAELEGPDPRQAP